MFEDAKTGLANSGSGNQSFNCMNWVLHVEAIGEGKIATSQEFYQWYIMPLVQCDCISGRDMHFSCGGTSLSSHHPCLTPF